MKSSGALGELAGHGAQAGGRAERCPDGRCSGRLRLAPDGASRPVAGAYIQAGKNRLKASAPSTMKAMSGGVVSR